jgi:hypothetical protein
MSGDASAMSLVEFVILAHAAVIVIVFAVAAIAVKVRSR